MTCKVYSVQHAVQRVREVQRQDQSTERVPAVLHRRTDLQDACKAARQVLLLAKEVPVRSAVWRLAGSRARADAQRLAAADIPSRPQRTELLVPRREDVDEREGGDGERGQRSAARPATLADARRHQADSCAEHQFADRRINGLASVYTANELRSCQLFSLKRQN